MWGRFFKGQSGQGGRPCGECCTGINICAPRPVAIGEASIAAWDFRLTNTADLTGPDPFDPDAKWYGNIVVSSTHTGKTYGWTFEMPHTRTFSIDMAAFGDNVYYFSDPVSVFFGPSRRTSFSSNVDGEILPGSPAAIEFEAAFGHDPFAVSLSVFPISSTIPEFTGTVDYPNVFSRHMGFDTHTPPPTIDEIRAGVWMTLMWWLPAASADNWGHIYDPVTGQINLTQVFTEQPRGWTFLTNGLGPLDDAINHFALGFTDFFGFLTSGVAGSCYPHRVNDFYGPVSVTISGCVMDPGFDEERKEIMNGLNDTYVCEFANTDGLAFIGRGSHWIATLTLPAVGSSDNLFHTFPVGDEDVEPGIPLLQLIMRLKHTGFLEMFFGSIFNQANEGVTNGQIASLPGTVTETGDIGLGGETVNVYITDPTQYAIAAAGISNFYSFQDPEAQFNMENLAVSIGSQS
jgi:hypothetical protein